MKKLLINTFFHTYTFVCLLGAVLVLSGCTAAQHADTLGASEQEGDRITAGVVQKEIQEGMDQADVVAALGSPNLVSRGKDGLETWIYDKISSTSARRSSSAGVGLLIIGASASASSSSNSERTLTVIIKFKDGKVVDFSYRTTTF